MSSPSNLSESSRGTANSVFDKLSEATLAYQQNHHADLSTILTKVPQHLSTLISHATHLKEKCQDARNLFKNVIDMNLQVIAAMRDPQYEPQASQSYHNEGLRTVDVPEIPGDPGSKQKKSYDDQWGAPQMVVDLTEKESDALRRRQAPRVVDDSVEGDDAASLAIIHNRLLQRAHDARDGIHSLRCWAVVFQCEEDFRRDDTLNSVRRVITSNGEWCRSYTKGGIPITYILSGQARISDIEDQNRTLSQRVLLADLFISFYSDVVQTLQFIHDNLDSFRTVHRKLSEEWKLVAPNGTERRDVLKQAVIATSEAYDSVE